MTDSEFNPVTAGIAKELGKIVGEKYVVYGDAEKLETYSHDEVAEAEYAHMPDVLEMPYRPELVGAGKPGEYPHTYRLGGATCLAGDVIGDYSFRDPLKVGDRLVFADMAHYTMVKSTTFNGLRLPDIATHNPETGSLTVIRRFGYQDYRSRLS